jgi:hypothetical protein
MDGGTEGFTGVFRVMVRHRTVYVASEAIVLAHEQGAFRLPDESMPSDSMIRGILRQLEDCMWLEREHL